jgi:hypothetical protein
MVEIRVALSDATGVHGLMRSLAGLFERSSISFDGKRNEVRVRAEWESRSVDHVIDTLESWLAAIGGGWAKLWIGDSAYTIATVGPKTVKVKKTSRGK